MKNVRHHVAKVTKPLWKELLSSPLLFSLRITFILAHSLTMKLSATRQHATPMTKYHCYDEAFDCFCLRCVFKFKDTLRYRNPDLSLCSVTHCLQNSNGVIMRAARHSLKGAAAGTLAQWMTEEERNEWNTDEWIIVSESRKKKETNHAYRKVLLWTIPTVCISKN